MGMFTQLARKQGACDGWNKVKTAFLRNKVDCLVPAEESGEEALRSYPEDALLRVQIYQPRSIPHHNFFFAFIAEVYDAWPDIHPFQPDNSEHLRAWLTVKAGYLEMFEWDFVGLPTTTIHASLNVCRALIKARAGDRATWFKIIGTKIYAAWPKSIKFEKMDEDEFKRFTTIVFALIYSEVGIDVDDYYGEWQNKHGGLQVAPTRKAEDFNSRSAGLYFC